MFQLEVPEISEKNRVSSCEIEIIVNEGSFKTKLTKKNDVEILGHSNQQPGEEQK